MSLTLLEKQSPELETALIDYAHAVHDEKQAKERKDAAKEIISRYIDELGVKEVPTILNGVKIQKRSQTRVNINRDKLLSAMQQELLSPDAIKRIQSASFKTTKSSSVVITKPDVLYEFLTIKTSEQSK